MPKLSDAAPSIIVGRCAVRNPDNYLLLVRREFEAEHNAGLWEFPGGKVGVGEIVNLATQREVFEETGLEVGLTSDSVLVDNRIIEDGELEGTAYIMFCAAGKTLGETVRLSSEHTRFTWEKYDDLINYDLTPETRKAAISLGKLALI